MTIPVFQEVMLPLLKLLGDKQEYSLRQVIDLLTRQFNLSKQEQQELVPSGQQAVFDNRVGWARTYMKKAGLIEYTRRGFFRITDRGLEVLAQNPVKIDMKFLEQFEEYRQFRATRREKPQEPEQEGGETPDIRIGWINIEEATATSLTDCIISVRTL